MKEHTVFAERLLSFFKGLTLIENFTAEKRNERDTQSSTSLQNSLLFSLRLFFLNRITEHSSVRRNRSLIVAMQLSS